MLLFDLAPDDARLWLRTQFVTNKIGKPIREPLLSPDQTLVPAAVLVPLVLREAGVSVLLTRRAEHLVDHPGQISFPGGRCEPSDESDIATALREAYEEVGLSPATVEVLGCLPEYCTATGFRVSPVVGVVSPPLELALDPSEVQEAFEVPLAFLLNERNHEKHTREVRGVMREYVAMPYGDYFIWGATAGLLITLREFLVQP